MKNMSKDPDIVIVGGGPVGCWTAIQAKRKNPALEIRVYERYPEYQRDHMLSIQRASFMQRNFIQRSLQSLSPEDAALFSQIAAANNNAETDNKGDELKKVTHIRTLDLEAILKAHCQELGVKFTYAKIESPQDAMTRHPSCELFVAADGARSNMREALIGPESTEEKDLLYSVDVKYEAKGQAHYTKEPTYDKIDMIVVKTVGRMNEDGKTPVALRFIIDRATYESIPDATFKNPLPVKKGYHKNIFHDDSGGRLVNFANVYVPPTLGDFTYEVIKFQDIRKTFTGENRIPDSERVSKVTLSQYASKKFAVTVPANDNHRAGWFFVGDAAMGIPFYRSINAGLTLGRKLGEIICDPETSADIKVKLYEAKREPTMREEFGIVARKLAGINTYRNYIRPTLQTSGNIARIGGIGIIAIPIAAIVLPIAYIGAKFFGQRLM